MHFNPDLSSKEIHWSEIAMLTSEGTEAYSGYRSKFPQDAKVWVPTSGSPNRSAILASSVFNSIPEPPPTYRHFSAVDPSFESSNNLGMPAALHTEANSFKVIEPSFFALNLSDHCGRTHVRNPIEMLNAVVESVQRWFRDNQQHRMAPLTEKQVKSWVLADAGPRGTSSAFSLENLLPKKRISTLGDLTNAVALFVEVEVFMRGPHMNIIADSFLYLVRVGQRRQNFGPRTMAMLLENRHLRLRAPIKIAAIGPTTQFSEADISDEAYERARAAFRFDSADHDLREAKDDPLREDDEPAPYSSSHGGGFHHSSAPRSQSQGQNALKRPRPADTRCPPPRRLAHMNGVCFQWVTDKHEKSGEVCDKLNEFADSITTGRQRLPRTTKRSFVATSGCPRMSASRSRTPEAAGSATRKSRWPVVMLLRTFIPNTMSRKTLPIL